MVITQHKQFYYLVTIERSWVAWRLGLRDVKYLTFTSSKRTRSLADSVPARWY